MLMPRTNYIQCKNQFEEYKMYYTTWGVQEESHKTLICVHGLNRNGRDWDYVGKHFARLGYFVVAPDIVGRGNSDYLTNPAGYDVPFYAMDIIKLIQVLQLRDIDYIGTSMGGIIGMTIAASPQNPIKHLVLNDIGAEIESSGLRRIAGYSVSQPEYASYLEAKNSLITISKDFGDLPDDVWEEMSRNSLQKNANGKYELKRDVNLAKPFNGNKFEENILLWAYWEKVIIPTLIIRGVNSDILSDATVAKMQQSNLKAKSVEVANAGHAPFLYSLDHFAFLQEFFTDEG